MDKLQQIIEISSRIFSKRGFDRSSMREISKAVNLTTAGLYHHIGSKEKLLNLVDDYLIKNFKDKIFVKIKWEEDPNRKIRQLLENLINTSLDNKELISIFLERGDLWGKYVNESKIRRKTLIKATEDIIYQFKKKGIVNKDVDITVVTYCLVGMINFVPQWFNPKGRLNRKQLIDSISSFIIKGLFK